MLLGQYVGRLLRDRRRLHPLHRRALDFALLREPLEEDLERSVTVVRCGRLEVLKQVSDEGLDVLAGDVLDLRRHAPVGEEVPEEAKRLAEERRKEEARLFRGGSGRTVEKDW